MRFRYLSAFILSAATLGCLAVLLGARRNDRLERTDFDQIARKTTPAFDARLAPGSDAPIKAFRIPIKDATVEIASGVTYNAWTFGGTVPGPVLRARVGDEVRITVVNESAIPHSIDFHAARVAPNVAYRTILPHDSVSFSFTARDAGAFMVHCGTPPVLMHLMQGMYLPIIVDPRGGWSTVADKEFVLVQSEFYAASSTAIRTPDWSAATMKNASQVVFNGRAFQYKENPLRVAVGDRVRLFVVNAGPNLNSDFHVVGAVFDRVYPDGDPSHALTHLQTYSVPPGGGAVFEAVFDGEGLYPFVTHSFADAEKGAVGIFHVGTPKMYAHMDH